MKNVLHQNQYLIIVSALLFIFQLYNTTSIYSQTIDQTEEYSYCNNWDFELSPFAAFPPPPPPPEPIEVFFGYEIREPGVPGSDVQETISNPGEWLIPIIRKYKCLNYDTLIVMPNRDFTRNGLFVTLYPKETTEYTITYKVTKDPYCENIYTKKVNVEVHQACSFSTNDIEDLKAAYTWVSSLENVCLNSIDVYEKNNTNYLMFNRPNSNYLFYQDGSGICSNSPDYSCLEAYQLTNKIKTYTCNQTAIENSVEETPNTFNTYLWLSDFVNPNACNGESVYVYDADTYEFLIIKTNLGESIYKTNGELICFSPADGFSFIGLYNESRILDSWHCEQGFQGRESKPTIQDQGIQIFPNPAKDKVFINLQQLTFEQPVISIYDVQGKQVKQLASAEAFAGIVQVNVSDLEQGIYLVEVRTSEVIFTEKLIVK